MVQLCSNPTRFTLRSQPADPWTQLSGEGEPLGEGHRWSRVVQLVVVVPSRYREDSFLMREEAVVPSMGLDEELELVPGLLRFIA